MCSQSWSKSPYYNVILGIQLRVGELHILLELINASNCVFIPEWLFNQQKRKPSPPVVYSSTSL